MKKLIFAFLTVVLLTIISNIFPIHAGETQVKPDYFTPDRIIDVSECLPYIQYGKSQFVFCMNIMVICESDVIKNPIGEEFGIKLGISGESEKDETLWKSGTLDTELKQWCGNWHKNNPLYKQNNPGREQNNPLYEQNKKPKTLI